MNDFERENYANVGTIDAEDRPRGRALSALEVMRECKPVELLEGIAQAGRVTVTVGESGAGKTFVLLDQAAAISDGVDWHGRRVTQGAAVYVSFEGDALGVRLRALRDITGRRMEHLYIIRATDPISPIVTRDGEITSAGELALVADLDALATRLRHEGKPPIVAVYIDTVRASLTGSEDSSEPVSAYLRAVRRILATVPGAACVLAHHAGWQDGESARKRERGSSAWRGNVDSTIYLEAGEYDPDTGETPITLKTLKTRDAETPAPLSMIRRRVELLEMNTYKEPVTSCVIERDRRSREDRDAQRAVAVEAAQQEADMAVLRAMRDYPEATSIARLRPRVGLRTDVVGEAVARILRAQLAREGRRGQPFTITPDGLERLNGYHS